MTALTQYAQKRVVSEIQEYCMNGYAFTSLDIANKLKNEGVRLRNRDVAEMLRSMVIPIAHEYHCLYQCSLIRVDSKRDGPTWAYLWHHKNTDPDTYLARDQNPQSVAPRNDALRSMDKLAATLQQSIDDGLRQHQNARFAKATAVRHKPAVTTDPHWKTQKRDANGRFC